MTDSADLRDLRRETRTFFEQHAPVRQQLADDPSLWKRLTVELGLSGLAVSTEHGGSGASMVELAAVLEESGRGLLRAPLLSTAVAAVVLEQAQQSSELPALLDGSRAAAVVWDRDVRVHGDQLTGAVAVVDAVPDSLLLVSTDEGLFATSTSHVSPLQPLDPTRPQGLVRLADTPAVRIGDQAAAAAAIDLLHVALAAESVGAARRALELTVAYLKTREQFGRPLGSFQALRHRVADLTAELEAATSTAWYAARAVADQAPDRAVVAPLAKASAADAFCRIAGECIQLHGGIGFTWEHDAHLYFKRAWSTALLHGDSRTLRRTAFLRAGC